MDKIILPRKKNFFWKGTFAWFRSNREDVLTWVQLITVFLLAWTAWLQYQESAQKRPFLSITEVTVRDSASSKDSVEWEFVIKNDGPYPAFQIEKYALGIIGGKKKFSLNLKEPQNLGANWDPCPDRLIPHLFCAKPQLLRVSNMIIPPEGSRSVTFLMSNSVFQAFLDSTNKEVDGVTFQLDYAGPGARDGFRPFFYQSAIIPWRDGAKIQFRGNNCRSN